MLELLARMAGGVGRTITAVVRPFADALRSIVNLVLTLMEAIGLGWSLILAPFARVFVELVRLLQRGVTAVVRLLRRITGALTRVLAIGATAVHRIARIVERVINALASAIRTIVHPLVSAMRRWLSSISTVVRSARAQFGQLIRLLLGPIVAAAHQSGLFLRRVTAESERVLRAAVAVARRFLWWLVRPVVVPARAAARWSIRHGRRLTARVRITRASITASVRATVRATRARVRRR